MDNIKIINIKNNNNNSTTVLYLYDPHNLCKFPSYKTKYKEEDLLPSQSGVYLILNNVNNKIYIGKSCNLRKRILYYRQIATNDNKKSKRYFEHALKKYNWNDFTIYVLYQQENYNKEQLYHKEAEFIKDFKSLYQEKGYNILPCDGYPKGHKFSEETKEKIRNSVNKYYQKLKEENKLPFSKGKKFDEERRESYVKYWESLKNKGKKIFQIDPNSKNVIKIWNSIKEASLQFSDFRKQPDKSICYALKKQVIFGGFLWKYVDNN